MIDPCQQLFDAFYDFLVPRYSLTTLRRRENGPSPKGHYLVIDDSELLQTFGTASKGYQSPTDYQTIAQDLVGQVALWEIGGGSATLSQFLVELNLQTSVEYFSGKRVSILKTGQITPVPDLDDNQYREQFRLGLDVAVAAGIVDTGLSYIETIDMTNNIGH